MPAEQAYPRKINTSSRFTIARRSNRSKDPYSELGNGNRANFSTNKVEKISASGKSWPICVHTRTDTHLCVCSAGIVLENQIRSAGVTALRAEGRIATRPPATFCFVAYDAIYVRTPASSIGVIVARRRFPRRRFRDPDQMPPMNIDRKKRSVVSPARPDFLIDS